MDRNEVMDIRSDLTLKLENRYGVLMTVGDVSETLTTSMSGFRWALRESRDPVYQALRNSKLKIGKHVYFSSASVAAALAAATGGAGAEE